MPLIINIQRVVNSTHLPTDKAFNQWVNAAQINAEQNAEITLRIVSTEEIQSLNNNYRNKDVATNVLSFASEVPVGPDVQLLADIVICADIVAQEAHEFGKALEDRWAHMVVHGCLHVQGFDHLESDERELMENKEIEVLKALGFSNPYQVD